MHALIGSRSPVNEILYEIQGSLLPEKVAFFADGSYRVFGWTVIYFVVNRREQCEIGSYILDGCPSRGSNQEEVDPLVNYASSKTISSEALYLNPLPTDRN